jgi:hypothetical protein
LADTLGWATIAIAVKTLRGDVNLGESLYPSGISEQQKATLWVQQGFPSP